MLTEHVLTLEKMFQFLLYHNSNVSICSGPPKDRPRDLEKSQFFLKKTRRITRLFEKIFNCIQSFSIKETIVNYVVFRFFREFFIFLIRTFEVHEKIDFRH